MARARSGAGRAAGTGGRCPCFPRRRGSVGERTGSSAGGGGAGGGGRGRRRSVGLAAVMAALMLARLFRRGPGCLGRPLRREAGGASWARGQPGARRGASGSEVDGRPLGGRRARPLRGPPLPAPGPLRRRGGSGCGGAGIAGRRRGGLFCESWDPRAASKNTNLRFFASVVCSVFMVGFQPSALFTF